MATIADYPDAVDRIAGDLDPGATTEAEIEAILRGDSPQLTDDVVSNLADAIVTEDDVVEAIDASGQIPEDDEIEAIAELSDQYEQGDRVESVSEAVRDRVATVEDIDQSVEAERPSDGPMFKEDVEDGVRSVASEKEIRGASPEDVVETEAQERGAPSETSFRSASASATQPDDAVSPKDLGIGEQSTPVNVIRDSSGEAVVAFGGSGEIDGQPAGEAVAESIGAEYAGTGTDALESIEQDFDVSGTGESVNLTFRGRSVGEVDV